MGYRTEWLNHEELLSVHSEVLLHAFDRVIADRKYRLLLIGVGNGGVVQVWNKFLPEGSVVMAVDSDPRVSELGLDVLVGDVNDRIWLNSVLTGQWFDLIIDSSEEHSPHLWPFLSATGVLIYDGFLTEKVMRLVNDVAFDADSWLPTEEIMAVTVFPTVAVIEKRNPRVVPYLEIIVGKDSPIIDEDFYKANGAKRITVT
jgi:hypothetical protein